MWRLHDADFVQQGGARVIRAWWMLGLLLASPALATTWIVDSGCPSSGTGTSLTCGASGPFKTISEGITAIVAGDTLNIRGNHASHGTCPGTNGRYEEYLGLWGTNADGFPGKNLLCTSGSPCVVQGCAQATCGSDEVPTITGLVQRTDWTQCNGGNGCSDTNVWFRTMENHAITAEYVGTELPRDNFDPEMIYQGAFSAKVPLQYAGDNSTAPADGKWSYNTSTHVIFINPTGTGSPNSAIQMWIPHERGLMTIAGAACPSAPCGKTEWTTFRRLTFDGSRFMGLGVWPGNGTTGDHGDHLTFDTITIRDIPRFFINPYQVSNLTLTNMTFDTGCRGISFVPAGSGGCFAFREADALSTVATNMTVSHLGTAGPTLECPWCDAPWNTTTGNGLAANGNGLDIKETATGTFSNITVSDVSFFGTQFDECHNVVLDGFNYQRTRTGIVVREFTPNAPNYVRNFNNTIKNGYMDTVGFNDTGGIWDPGQSALSAGDFGLHIFNVFISRPSMSGISITNADQIGIWNNTIWGQNPFVSNVANGIELKQTVTNADVRNNIIANVTRASIEVSAASASAVFDYDNWYDTGERLCAARRGVTTYDGNQISTNGTCDTNQITYHTATGNELHGQAGNPAFVNTAGAPPNLHITTGSFSKDTGVALTSFFTTDADGDTRPLGPAWDSGADEFNPGGTTTTTSTSSSIVTTSSSSTSSSSSSSSTSTSVTSSTLNSGGLLQGGVCGGCTL